MVKPALPYLDIIYRAARETLLPLAAYSVSGEYAMIKAAARLGLLDEKRAVCEASLGILRAGADILISYYAPQLAEWSAGGGL
jgi:porphobilinogen synthase